jgi:hypothetical protein
VYVCVWGGGAGGGLRSPTAQVNHPSESAERVQVFRHVAHAPLPLQLDRKARASHLKDGEGNSEKMMMLGAHPGTAQGPKKPWGWHWVRGTGGGGGGKQGPG